MKKNTLKSILCLLLVFCMAGAMLAGCATTADDDTPDTPEETPVVTDDGGDEGEEAAAVSFTAGTYTGTGGGYGGSIVLDVTFSDTAITDIAVNSQAETEYVGTPAIDILIEDMINFNSTGVDVVSGATFTSRGVVAAVEDAAEQAGCDVDALRAVPAEHTAGELITDTYDVVVVGGGGAGVVAAAQAAQDGATVLLIEKNAELGGNTLVAGCSYQCTMPCLVWDPADPDATTGVYEVTGEEVTKVKSDAGRLDTLRMILNWSEEPFDGTVEDPSAIHNVDDYNLPERGVHEEYLPTLLTLKDQIREYLAWADEKMAAGAAETDLTLFSTVELHIFQTYYGGLRLNAEKTEWIYNDFDLVNQMCTEIYDTKAWLIDQGALFDNTVAPTLIGCLWQRINRFQGGVVNGEEVPGKWGTYFATTKNTLLSANEKNQIMLRTTATELMTDETGRVVGVKAEQYDGTPVEITAGAVVLATGGYAANIDMVLETNDYWSEDDVTASILTTNRSCATGDGIVMGQAVGAATTGMGFTQLMPIGWANTGVLAGGNGEDVIFISPAGTENAGKRYVDESAERDVLSQGAYDFGGEHGLFIQLMNGGDNTSANDKPGQEYFMTLAEAAEMLEIDYDVLLETVTTYDDAVRNGTFGSLDVPKASARALIGNYNEDGSFDEDGIISVRYLAPSTHHTMGGLVVDLDRHVLTEDGSVIEGLYAAGEVTGGFFAGNRLGGNAITEILVSGRIAGKNAAAE